MLTRIHPRLSYVSKREGCCCVKMVSPSTKKMAHESWPASVETDEKSSFFQDDIRERKEEEGRDIKDLHRCR